MKKPISLKAMGSDCECCDAGSGASPAGYGCGERATVLTPREQKVLAEIRELQERARRLKAQIEGWREDDEGGALSRWREELERLRDRRRQLEAERNDAARERMRLLGHD